MDVNSLLIRSRLYSRILTELSSTSRLSERFYSERISRTLCKPLDSKRKRGIILCGSKRRPLSAFILLDMAWMLTAYLSVAAFIAVYSLNSVVLPTVLADLMRNVYAVPSASPFTVNVSVVLFFVVASAVHFPPLYCSIT